MHPQLLVVDDSKLIRDSRRGLPESIAGGTSVAEAASLAKALQSAWFVRTQTIPGSPAQLSPGMRVVTFTLHGDRHRTPRLAGGADGSFGPTTGVDKLLAVAPAHIAMH